MNERHLVFGDESGTADLRDDPYFPVFAVAMCVFEELKLRHFGRRDAPLHERDIRMRQGPSAGLRGESGWREFAGDLSDVIDAAPFEIAAVAIDKRAPSSDPLQVIDPYPLCASIGIERIERSLTGSGSQLARIVFEGRGRKEDRRLRADVMAFRRVLKEQIAIYPDMEFETKAAGLIGLGIADLVAYPIGRSLIDRPQPNLPMKIVKRKFLHGANGERARTGLTIIPR